MRRASAALVLLATWASAGCLREVRKLTPPADAVAAPREPAVATIYPGPADSAKATRPDSLTDSLASPSPPDWMLGLNDQENAYALNEGKTLFSSFNCNGCHGAGGGSIGPPLMDGEWRYGSTPRDVYASIAQGRPNGMPAFGGRISQYQMWELVGYVRSMSGLVSGYAAPGRDDHMNSKIPEQNMKKQKPVLRTPEQEKP